MCIRDRYFFNLPPDNDYIKWTVGKAMYMADGTALKQKTAYEIMSGDWSSDVCSSDLIT